MSSKTTLGSTRQRRQAPASPRSPNIQIRFARNSPTVTGGIDARYAHTRPAPKPSTKSTTSRLVDSAPSTWKPT